MAGGARIRNLVLIGHLRANKSERVAADVYIGDGLLDLRHMTGNTVISCASDLVMRVLFYRACVRAVR